MKQNDDLKSFTVTLDLLLESNACDKETLAFANAFPSGTASMRDVVEHPACEPEWLGWLAVNSSFVTADIGMELIQRSDDPGYYYADAAVWAHWVTAETGQRLIMLSDDPHLTFGRAAAFAHWVTAEIGPGMISKSSEPKHFAQLAIIYAEWMTPEIKAELIAKYGD